MNLKKASAVLILFGVLTTSSFAQILEPVKWTWEASKKSVKVGDELELVFTGQVDDTWYVYANEFDPECGPILATITFTADPSVKTVGTLKAINPKTKRDDAFDCEVKILKGTAVFRQKIKVLSKNLKISGTFNGQVCTEVNGRCVQFDVEFAFTDIVVTEADVKKKP
jgi:hypothetical protein